MGLIPFIDQRDGHCEPDSNNGPRPPETLLRTAHGPEIQEAEDAVGGDVREFPNREMQHVKSCVWQAGWTYCLKPTP